jgi:hypothetical protein
LFFLKYRSKRSGATHFSQSNELHLVYFEVHGTPGTERLCIETPRISQCLVEPTYQPTKTICFNKPRRILLTFQTIGANLAHRAVAKSYVKKTSVGKLVATTAITNGGEHEVHS